MTTLTLTEGDVRALFGPTLPYTTLLGPAACEFVRVVGTGDGVFAVATTGKSLAVSRIDYQDADVDFLIHRSDAYPLLQHPPDKTEVTPGHERLAVATWRNTTDMSLAEPRTMPPSTFPKVTMQLTAALSGHGDAPIGLGGDELERLAAVGRYLGQHGALNLYPPARPRAPWMAAYQDRILIVVAPHHGGTYTSPGHWGKARGALHHADPLDRWPGLVDGGVL